MRIKRTTYWNGKIEDLKGENVKALLDLKDLKAVVLINTDGNYTVYEKEEEVDKVIEHVVSKKEELEELSNTISFNFKPEE